VNFLKQWPPDDPLSVLEASSPFTWPYYDGRFVDFYRKVRHHNSFSRPFSFYSNCVRLEQ
jgi:hypothetical protein